MYDTPLTIDQILTRLPETLPLLAQLTAGLTPAQLTTRPAASEWSLNDILAHLRACADMWGGYIARLLAEDHPTFRAVNPTTWIKQTNYPDLQFRPSLRAFTRQRAALVVVLQPLPPRAWSRAGTVTGAGRPLQRTVLTYAQWLVNHERSHFRTIRRVAEALRGSPAPNE
jgi:hypothetical protein